MRANPGGQIPASQVVGRQALIDELWRHLARQSVVLAAERRMGKTSILRKMVDEPPRDGVYVFQDLEGVHSEIEFAEKVLHGARKYFRRRQRALEWVRQLVTELGGTEIGGVIKFPDHASTHWKRALDRTIEGLLDTHTGAVVLLWDELPFMLQNIKRKSGEEAAMQVLSQLRALRQTHPRLRMVYTGSIGLHNVVTALRRASQTHDATNDMLVMEVPPLAPADAEGLAHALLVGEKVRADVPAVAAAIARETDGMPYFIHHVVDTLARHGGVVDPALTCRIVADRLVDPDDPWHLRYYRERLDNYYQATERDLALVILDALAGDEAPLAEGSLTNRASLHIANGADADVQHVMGLLQREHYVIRDVDGGYRFRFPLIRRFWRVHRRLGA